MKTCNKCKEQKPLSEFPKNITRKDGYLGNCKACQRAYVKNHYDNNVEYYVEKAKKEKQRVRDVLNELKSVPCTDCGETYPPYVMDFDHLGDKEFNIGQSNKGMKKMLAEVAKCEVVCANCHRTRTHLRNKENATIRP